MNIDQASELARKLINRVTTHHIELFEKESARADESKIKEILDEMGRMKSTRPGSRMGLWGADTQLKSFSNQLHSINYLGVRPLRQYSPPPQGNE